MNNGREITFKVKLSESEYLRLAKAAEATGQPMGAILRQAIPRPK